LLEGVIILSNIFYESNLTPLTQPSFLGEFGDGEAVFDFLENIDATAEDDLPAVVGFNGAIMAFLKSEFEIDAYIKNGNRNLN